MKAWVAKRTVAEEFHDLERARESWCHDYLKLLKIADLTNRHDLEIQSNPDYAASWNVVKRWKEDRRYQSGCAESVAREFVDAVGNQANGVLKWLQSHW